MNLPTHPKVQWMFVGSRATETEKVDETMKLRDKMPRKEREMHSSYLSIEERAMPILLDEKKCISMFGAKYGKYDNMFFHKVLPTDKHSFKDKLRKYFSSASKEFTLIVYSGNARPSDGSWIIESASKGHPDSPREETINFEDLIDAWRKRDKGQRHLLLIIDAPYSGHWLRKLSVAGESTMTIQTSCRYWQRCVEDRYVGGYFLHNLYKVVFERKGDQIIEPSAYKQNPGFYGNFHYVIRYFGLYLKFESWQDMRKAISDKEFGNWPRIKDWIRTPFSKIESDARYDDYNKESYYIDKGGQRYEGNVDRFNNKEGFGVLYSKDNVVEYEGQFKADKKHGKGVLYDSEGYKVFEGDFAEDEVRGAGVKFDRAGNICFVGTFENGKETNEGREFNERGKVTFIGSYQNGNRHGSGIEYHANGEKKTEGNWYYGKLNGLVKEYSDEGILLYEGDYQNGFRTGQVRTYYPDGKLHYEGGMLNGIFHGYGKVYNKTGELNCEGEFVSGNLQGIGTTYYLNGNVLFNGEFENGKAIGVGFLKKESGKVDMEGKAEDVIREVITSGVYAERKRTKRFEGESLIAKDVTRKDSAKQSLLMQTSNLSDAFQQRTSSLLASSFVKRQSLSRPDSPGRVSSVDNTGNLPLRVESIVMGGTGNFGQSINDGSKRKTMLNPLNPKGMNDIDAEKTLKATHTMIDYKTKKIIEKMEKESQKAVEKVTGKRVSKAPKPASGVNDSKLKQDQSNIAVELSQEQIKAEEGTKPETQTQQNPSLEVLQDAPKGSEDNDFESIYLKKFDANEHQNLKDELYGNKPDVESDKHVEIKKRESAEMRKEDFNPFLKKEFGGNIEVEVRNGDGADKLASGSPSPAESGPLKKNATEPQFENFDSFQEVKAGHASYRKSEFDPTVIRTSTFLHQAIIPEPRPSTAGQVFQNGQDIVQSEIQTTSKQSSQSFNSKTANSQASKKSSKKSSTALKKKSIRATLTVEEEEGGTKTYLMNI